MLVLKLWSASGCWPLDTRIYMNNRSYNKCLLQKSTLAGSVNDAFNGIGMLQVYCEHHAESCRTTRYPNTCSVYATI